jgi:hypothetical protein
MSDDEPEEKESRLGNVFKKVVSSGINAAFQSEESIRNKLSEIPVPKEVMQSLLNNAKSTKEDFLESAKTELKQYLQKINLSKEIDRILEEFELVVDAKINFKKKENGPDSKKTEKSNKAKSAKK